MDAAHFRHVVGHLASGVTVITTDAGDLRYGMTASSVTSLSADPPMMLACLNNAVPTAEAVTASGRYAVNVLGDGQGELARQFASPSPDKFRGVAVHPGTLGLPLLSDALAHIECEVVERVTGGTHTIFLGHVRSATAGNGQPLTYFRGGFGRFAFAKDDEVYGRARELVLSRAYPADTALPLEDLAARLEVDDAAAFYALTRLSSDGLVRRDADRGYVIAPLDVRTSDETFDARLAVELGVLALALDHVTDDEVAELNRRFDTMAALLVGERFVDFHGYLDANYAMHEYLVSLAGNPLLTNTFGRLGIKNVMTRSFGVTPETSQKFVEAQGRLVHGVATRNPDAARRGAVEYCELAKERVREILTSNGGRI
ncbi:flavin reductase [Paractinoplanes lichenicola]|uniref:Flavin reductase n=1 Tax=Paractinoplanes lichenicola TaxID=2802976 RepID=A0ABS1VVU0_9ACTN|nr:flavin reductase [Actinoplanes lichenicola]MBL7258565.1 flavin reductase [Actinoplanes lichenicola]